MCYPGSGKTSYANYRYGIQHVVAADDYFDINHGGEFVPTEIKHAHDYCQSEVMKRLYRQETVVVANTHSTYWQIWDKITPVLFDKNLPHKIVFAVMPEQNSTTLVRRCVHGCTKPKIVHYIHNIQYMLSLGPITSLNVLKYGNMGIAEWSSSSYQMMIDNKENMRGDEEEKEETKRKRRRRGGGRGRGRGRYRQADLCQKSFNSFDYGLWMDAEDIDRFKIGSNIKRIRIY